MIARLLYASSAWWEFTSSSDRQGIAVLSIDELVSNTDDKLFICITSDKHHVLHQLLPPDRPDCGYSLRPRRHELHIQIPARWTELHSQNAAQRHVLNVKFYAILFFLFVTCAVKLLHVSF